MSEVKFLLQSVNPQPWRFTNNSLGLPHAPALSVYLFPWVCVVYVCYLLYLSFYLCCVAACFVFCSIFLAAFVSSFIFFYKINRNLCHGAYWCAYNPANMPKLFFHLMFTSIIPAYVCLNMYTLSPPLPCSYTCIAIFICLLSFCCLLIPISLFSFFLVYKFDRHLCHGAYPNTFQW